MGGLVFNITGVMAFGGIFGSVLGIIPLIGPYMREHEKRLYSPTLFYIISTLYHLPSQIFLCAFYQVMFFWVIDMRRGWESFWKYFIIFLTTYFAASGFGDILSIAIRNLELINQLFPIVVVPLFMTSGFIAAVRKMVPYLIGYSYLSFFKFPLQAGIIVEFYPERVQQFLAECTIKPIDCKKPSCSQKVPNSPFCDPFRVYDFYETSYWVNILGLLIQSMVFRIVAAMIWCKFTADIPIPYEPLPAPETFKGGVPKSKHSEAEGLNKVHPLGA